MVYALGPNYGVIKRLWCPVFISILTNLLPLKVSLFPFNLKIRADGFLIFLIIFQRKLGVVGCGKGVVYLMSPGHPTEIGKACYPCSG